MMTHNIHTYDNGLTLIHIPRNNSKLFKINIRLGAGSSKDEINNFPSGTAHFTEHMVFNGSQKYPSKNELGNIVLKNGSQRNGVTGWFSQNYFVSCLLDHYENAFEYLSQLLLYPLLSINDFNKEKSIIVSEFKKNESLPDKKFYIHGIMRSMVQNVSLGNYALGSQEGIESLNHSHIIDFHKKYFVPGNMTIVVTGNVNFNKLLKSINTYFCSGYEKKYTNDSLSISLKKPHNSKMIYPGISNTKMAMGFVCDKLRGKRYYSTLLLFKILASGSQSRLYQEIREKRGLTYQIFYFTEFLPNNILYNIATESEQKNANIIKKIILDEIKNISLNGIQKSELHLEVNKYIYMYQNNIESTNVLCEMISNHYTIFNEVLDPDKELAILNSITTKDIQRSAQKLLEQKPFWTTMAPE